MPPVPAVMVIQEELAAAVQLQLLTEVTAMLPEPAALENDCPVGAMA
jgi:hypothetical protein